MDSEVVVVTEPPLAPDSGDDLVVGHDTTRLGGQHQEDLEFSPGEIDGGAT